MSNSITTLISLILLCSIVEAQNGGFTIELIHRDSPLSPFYNPSDTYSTQLRNSVLRSRYRISSSSLPNSIQSDVIPNGGSYLMKLSIGTPPVGFLAIADTGSDLIWTQCNPCEQCYQQDAQVFDSQQSSTYKRLPCSSNYCRTLPRAQCGNSNADCEYIYSYGDRSYTNGDLANETFTFDSTNGNAISIPDIVFGCGHKNGGTFDSHGSGLVGLGGGPLSLVSQLGSVNSGKFCYCLVPISDKATSKLKFGNSALISSTGKVSTPLVSKAGSTFYYVKLEGISVGNKRNDNVGNILIDSGTTLTYLNADLYSEIESAVQKGIGQDPVQDPSETFSFCYNTKEDLRVPEITFHFTGAELRLSSMNTFVRQTEELVCFVMAPSQDTTSIFGNLNQVNFQVEYDLQGRRVSFAPADCTKF